MASRPFRFSVQSFNTKSADDWRNQVRTAESLGYSAFHLADHYLGPGRAREAANHPHQDIAAIPAMAMAAEATSRIKIGCRVLCVGYRPAAVLVKEAMTLDFLSGGRLELGLGAGWMASEYAAMGLALEPPAKRIERLRETIALMKQAMTGGALDVHGQHVHVAGYDALPVPVQKPVPLMIGGGSARILRLAGREADIVSLNFSNRMGRAGSDGPLNSTHDATLRKIGWVEEGAGDRFAALELEIGAYCVSVTEKTDPAIDRYSAMWGVSAEEMRKHPHALIGSIDSICDELCRRREVFGTSYVNVPYRSMTEFAPVVEQLHGK